MADRVAIVFEAGEKQANGDTPMVVTLEGVDYVTLASMTPDERRETLPAAAFWAFEIMVRFVIPTLRACMGQTAVRVLPAREGKAS
jgi:hypothetical protein